jgi:Arc/MetJ-type ribon-helix-helix transcriptional regulator
MDVSLPADLRSQVEQELASGRYANSDQLITDAMRQFFDERNRDRQRHDSLRRIGQAVDDAGLYEENYGDKMAPTTEWLVEIHAASIRRGTDKLTMRQIDAEIRKVQSEPIKKTIPSDG